MSQQPPQSRNAPASRPVARRQASPYEREQQRQRIVIGVVVVGMLAAVLILLVPYLKTSLWDPSRQVAAVGDETITRGEYAKYQKLATNLGTDPSVLPQIFQPYRENPQQVRDALESQQQQAPSDELPEVTGTGLDPMINAEVLVQSAPQAGITVTDEQVSQKLREYLYPAGAAGADVEGTATPAVAAASPQATVTTSTPQATAPAVTPTAGPPSDADVDGFFGLLSDTLGVSEADYRDLVVRPALIRDQYQEKNVPKATKQVHVRHILVNEKAAADKILQQLRDGTKFEVLAKQSIDESNRNKGGDLGWAPAETYVPEFSKAAFALTKPGQLSSPVKTEFGYHVIQLIERAESRPLTEQQRQQVGQKKVADFVDQQRERLKKAGDLEIGIPPTPTPAPTVTVSPTG
jgi:parvulin-like peptidyl-prolyl isomerase